MKTLIELRDERDRAFKKAEEARRAYINSAPGEGSEAKKEAADSARAEYLRLVGETQKAEYKAEAKRTIPPKRIA